MSRNIQIDVDGKRTENKNGWRKVARIKYEIESACSDVARAGEHLDTERICGSMRI